MRNIYPLAGHSFDLDHVVHVGPLTVSTSPYTENPSCVYLCVVRLRDAKDPTTVAMNEWRTKDSEEMIVLLKAQAERMRRAFVLAWEASTPVVPQEKLGL